MRSAPEPAITLFIEIMRCPGDCINGGGMPVIRPSPLPNEDHNIVDTFRQKRTDALYGEDEPK